MTCHPAPRKTSTRSQRLPAIRILATVGLQLTLLVSSAVAAEDRVSLQEALTGGSVEIDLRYRFENVDQDAFAKAAHASTLRSSIGYRTGTYRGFSLFLEAEHVTEIGFDDQFRNLGAGSLDNGVRDRPVVADPASTEVEQAYLRYTRGKMQITAGRQAIAIGDQRFVGPVAWRQNRQSFDALRVEAVDLGPIALTYTYIDNVNRFLGDDRPMESHLMSADFELAFGRLSTYAYLLDFTLDAHRLSSTATCGVELTGKAPLPAADLLFEVEYARQEAYADNPTRRAADYLHAKLAFASERVTVEAGFERLEGGSTQGAFQTPLADLHALNGWADQFLHTPSIGLEDLSLAIRGESGRLAWLAAYHDFSAQSRDLDYGTELDLQVTYETPWNQLFGLKAAFYDAEIHATDTEKLWFWTTVSF